MLHQPDTDGLMKSRCIPGLWLDVSALLSGQMAIVLTTQQRALESESYQHFVEHVQSIVAKATD